MISEKFARLLILAGFIFIIIGAAIFGYKQHYDLNSSIDSDLVGQYSNFVTGFSGSLWALAGVILFYVALSYTKDTYSLQKDELKQQNDFYYNQKFDSTFFNLLMHIDYIVEHIEYKKGNTVWKGRKFIEQLAYEFKENQEFSPSYPEGQINILEVVENFYKNNYDDLHGEIGHYFRTLYHMAKFIYESKVSTKDKIFYFRIFRAKLSNYDLILIAANGLSTYGSAFKDLINDCGLLHNLHEYGNLLNSFKEVYKPSAFMSFSEIQNKIKK